MSNSDQIRAGRAIVGWSNAELAEHSGISVNTITRAERGEAKDATINALAAALESAGVTFLPDDGAGPGVRFKVPKEEAEVTKSDDSA